MNSKTYIIKETNDKHQFLYKRIDGSIVVPFGTYDWGDDQFVFGFARICKNKKWGIINTLGLIVVPIVYDKIWVLSEEHLSDVKCELGNNTKTIDLRKATKICVLDGLDYIKSYDIEEFKSSTGASRIDVKKSPITNLLYFQAGLIIGKVSVKDRPMSPKISLVKNSNNVVFWLLHEEEDTGKMFFIEKYNTKSKVEQKVISSKSSYYYEEEIDYEEQTLDAFEGDDSNYWNIE